MQSGVALRSYNGEPTFATMPRIRTQLDDFEVDEILDPPANSDGDFLWLRVEKRDLGTPEAGRALAQWCGVDDDRVNFAGRKDRRAVTRQWFSIHRGRLPTGEPPDGLVIVDQRQASQRIRLGELSANRFRIVVREIAEDEALACVERAPRIQRSGFPNVFGPQRFGPNLENLERGRRLLAGDLSVGRRDRRFLISALQSAVFNAVVARRTAGIDEVVVGDLAISHRTGLVRSVVDPEEVRDRVVAGKLSPSGPLPGPKIALAGGEPGRIELEECTAAGLVGQDFKRQLEKLGMSGERRSLRAFCRDLSVSRLDDSSVVLSFSLESGGYATSLIGSVFEKTPDAFD